MSFYTRDFVGIMGPGLIWVLSLLFFVINLYCKYINQVSVNQRSIPHWNHLFPFKSNDVILLS